MIRQEHRTYAIAAVIMVIVTIGCLRTSPFHVLSRDFGYVIQIVSLLMAMIIGFLSSRNINAAHHPPSQQIRISSVRLKKDAYVLCGLVSIPYLAVLLSSYLVQQCRVFEGSIAFGVSVVPSFLFGLVWGYSVGMLTTRWRRFLRATLVLFLLLSLYDTVNILLGTHFEYMYLVLGNAPSQRAEILPNGFHLYSRAFLLCMTALVYKWSTWFAVRKHQVEGATHFRLGRMVFMTLGLLLIGWATQGFTGLGWSHARIEHYLSNVKETDVLRLYYHPAHQIQDDAWRKIAWESHRIVERMQVSTGKKVEVYIFPSSYELTRYTNSASSAFAKMGRFYVSERSLDSTTFPHELVHALHYRYAPSWWIIVRRSLLEGVAVAFADGMTLAPEYHEEMAVLEQEGKLPSIEAIYRDIRFVHHPEGLAYDASGSFIGFLVLEYGIEKFKQFNRSLNFATVYGSSLEALNIQWKTFLQKIPVDYVEGRQVSQYYTRLTSYTARSCPQVGTRCKTPEEAANALAWWLDPAGSKALFEELRQLHADATDWQVKYLLALIANNELSLAHSELNTLFERANGPDDFTYDLYHLKFFLHVLENDRNGASEDLQRMIAIAQDDDGWQALRLQLLRHPTIGPEYFASLTMGYWEQRLKWMTLHTLDDAFGPAYIYAYYFTEADPDPTPKRRLLEEFVTRTAGFHPLKFQAYKDFLQECLRYRFYDEAEVTIAQVNALDLSNKERIEIAEFSGRIGFEKQRFPRIVLFPPYRFRHLYEIERINRLW